MAFDKRAAQPSVKEAWLHGGEIQDGERSLNP